ncbi:MAG TPA: HisA/HisF-related TIM barrel protein [Longimicrobiales bacterium]
MNVIPVLDLRAGRAVHARGGKRERYDIVQGVLGTGDDPLALALAFRDQLGLTSLYIADLDAIAGKGNHHALIARLAREGFTLWVDGGVRDARAAESLAAVGAARVVVGLETLPSLAALPAIASKLGPEGMVFSLDLLNGKPLSPDPVLATTDPLLIAGLAVAAGARTLIVLDVARVGTVVGPSPLLAPLRAALPTIHLVAGGGVRDRDDLQALSARGCTTALVATALHEGTLAAEDLPHPIPLRS